MDACSCEVDYDAEPTIHNVTTPVARKRYKCCECGCVIAPGDQYERVEGLWDGDWSTCKTCRPCSLIRRNFPCGEYGMLRADLWECLGFDYVTGEWNKHSPEIQPEA